MFHIFAVNKVSCKKCTTRFLHCSSCMVPFPAMFLKVTFCMRHDFGLYFGSPVAYLFDFFVQNDYVCLTDSVILTDR